MLALFIITIIVVLVDQALKVIVVNTLTINEVVNLGIIKIEYVQNISTIFGKNINILLIVIWLILVSFFVFWFLTTFSVKIKNRYNYIPFIMVVSGIITNIIDRITKGFVVAYVKIPLLLGDYSFNFGHACLFIGLMLTGVFYLLKINDDAFNNMDLEKIEKRKNKDDSSSKA